MKELTVIQPPAAPVPTPPAATAAFDMVADPSRTETLKPALVKAISSVFDPEIPVNIYELGLIYDVLVDASNRVLVRMTLTAPACPSAQSLPIEVERRVREVADVTDARVDVVWDPPWDREMMSQTAKLALGMF